jgi:hypothetical protein
MPPILPKTIRLNVPGQNELLMAGSQAARLTGVEAGFAEHAVNFGQGVRVARGRGAEHSHGEEDSVRRGNAIFVRHELDQQQRDRWASAPL